MKPTRKAFAPQRYVSDTTFEIQTNPGTVLRFVLIPEGMRVDVERRSHGTTSAFVSHREVADLAALLQAFKSAAGTKMTCSMSWTDSEVIEVTGRRLKVLPLVDGLAATYSPDSGIRVWVISNRKRAAGRVTDTDTTRLAHWLAEAAKDMR